MKARLVIIEYTGYMSGSYFCRDYKCCTRAMSKSAIVDYMISLKFI